MSCIFCKIAQGEVPASKLFENEHFFCIKDIHPQARTHLLVVPKAHIASLDHAYPESGSQAEQVGNLLRTATLVARQQRLLPGGFRLVINTGQNGGQTVDHLHAHILSSSKLKGSFGE